MGIINTFYGADAKVGVTMLTQVIAERAAKQMPEKNFLLLHLDGREGFDYVKEKSQGSLDTLRAAICAEVLTEDEIKTMCLTQGNLYLLRGTSNILERHTLYNIEIIEKLFKIVKTFFDYIIVDAGHSVDSPLTIGSLLNSDENVLVTTQQSSSRENYLTKEQQILSPLSINFSKLVVNKFSYSSGKLLDTEQTLSARYNLENVFSLPKVNYGWQAEYEKTSLITYKNKLFLQSTDNFVNYLYSISKDKKIKKIFRR